MAISEEMRLAIRLTAQDSTKQAFGQLNQSLDGLKRTALTAAAAIGSALALRDVIASTQSLGEQVDLLRDNLGLTAQQASAWNVIARVTGTSAEEISQAMGVLNRKLIDQIPLMDEGKDDFTKWGVAVRDASGAMLPLDVVVGNIRDKLRSLPPGLDRSGAAMDLLGRSGRQLIDFFTIGDARAKEFLDSAREMGLIMGEDDVNAIEELTQKTRFMGLQFDALKLQLGQALLPLLVRLFDWLRRGSGIIKAFGEALRYPFGIIKGIADAISKFLGTMKENFGKALATLAGDLKDTLLQVLSDIGTKLDSLGPLGTLAKDALLVLGAVRLSGLLIGLAGVIAALGSLPVAAALAGVAIVAVADNVGVIANNWERVRLAAERGLLADQGPVGMFLQRMVEIGNGFSALGTTIQTTFSAIGSFIGGIFDAIGTKIGQVIFDATVALNQLILNINKISPIQFPTIPGGPAIEPPRKINPFRPGPPEPEPLVDQRNLIKIGESAGGEMGIFFNPATGERTFMPLLQFGGGEPLIQAAHGGIFTRPTQALIGEAGPEAVIPLSRMGDVGGVTINVYGDVDSRERIRELANQVSDQIMRAYTLAGNYRISRGGLA